MRKLLYVLIVLALCLPVFVPTEPVLADSLSRQVSASANDGAWSTYTNWFSVATTSTYFGYLDATYRTFGSFMRFTNITIPRGATIAGANVTFVANHSKSNTTCKVLIRAIAADDAAAPTTRAEAMGAPRTTASVAWSSIPAWTAETSYTSPDIASVIQELVNRPGWSSGNAIVIYEEDNGSTANAHRQAYSFDGSAAKAPTLHVEYVLNPPTAATLPATDVTGVLATLHGEATEVGSVEITERGFVWDEISKANPGNVHPDSTAYAEYWTEIGSWGTEVFERAIAGLDVRTTYYFRAAVKNNLGLWAYGDEVVFTTQGPPVVASLAAAEVKDTYAILRGQVTETWGLQILERGFDWGTAPSVYVHSWTQLGMWDIGSFSTALTGLQKGVTHYFRAKARNIYGWDYGDELTFATFNPSIYASCVDDDDSDAEVYGPNWYAQTFTPYEGFKLAAVRIKAAAVNITGPLTVSIRETTDLGVIRTLDLVSAVYDGLGSLDWYEIPMPEYYLENKEYALVIRAVAGDAANYVRWRYASNSTCSGCYASSVNSGTSWTHNCDRSFMYEIRGHTTLKIHNAQVYTGYLEDGDWLVTVYYLNEYPPYYGTTVMSDYFALQLMVGGLPVVSTRLRQWGQMPGSLYISKALAETLSWGETYQVRMIGLYDPYPFTTYTLIPPDWKGSDLKRLDSWVIETAKSISTKYETALVTVANKNEVLNELGSVLFKVGVPMLEKVRPHLFLFPDVQTPYSETKWTRAYADSFDYTELWGDKVLDDAAAVGGMLGITGLDVLRLVFFGTWAIAGVGAVAVVGTGAIFVMMPFLIIGTLSGILDITPLGLLVALIVMTLVYVIWFRGT